MTATDTAAPAQHDAFTIRRTLPFAPAKVFAAFGTAAGKARWFAGGTDWLEQAREFDFRVGGRELAQGRWPSGMVTRFDAVYHDIVADRRIVYSYVMHLDEKLISVSLATIEFRPDGKGTELVLTEQGTFLNGYQDNGSRLEGTNGLMDRMAQSLAH